MAKAVKSLWNLSQEEAEREYLFALEKQERDRISSEDSARREGRQKGKEEGIEQGLKEGIVKGRKKGQQEGKRQECRNIALNMLKSGLDTQAILDATKLSKEKLEQLKVKEF